MLKSFLNFNLKRTCEMDKKLYQEQKDLRGINIYDNYFLYVQIIVSIRDAINKPI